MKISIITIQYLLISMMVVNVVFTWGQASGAKDGLVLAFVAVLLLRMKIESDQRRSEARRAIDNLRTGRAGGDRGP